jgi:hypothetical protein
MSAAAANGACRRTAEQRPEIELLLCCGRARLSTAQAARVRALAAGALDWNYLLSLADRHGLQPLLYYHLNKVCAASVPADQHARLRAAAQRVAAFNTLLTRELQKLLALFASEGIAAMPYKGPSLAAEIYDNVALRQYGDLDILVRRADVARAGMLLSAEGYATYLPLTAAQQEVLLRTQCNLPFTRERNRLVVELHWAVSAPHFARPFAADELWTRREPAQLAETRIERPAAEDMLLALCVHGAKHLWERLAWLCDIAGLIEQHGRALKWAELINAARATGSERMLFLGLRLAADLLGAELPPAAQQAVAADQAVANLATAVRRDLFTPELTPSGLGGYFRFQLRARRRLRDKLNYLRFAVTPTEEDLAKLAVPAPFTFVYYLLRPMRMLITGGPRHFH